MTSTAVDPSSLNFRFPRQVPDCSCPICVRHGDSTIDTNYPSPFSLYRLIKWDPVAQVERVPTEEERAEFNQLYPTMAFSRTAATGGKLDTPWVKLCLKLIRRLKKEKIALSFLHPVDPVALQIPDYPSIILHPMDLTTVERKLMATETRQAAADVGTPVDAGVGAEKISYGAPEEFASDVRMIWRNSFLCTNPTARTHECAPVCSC